MPAHAAPLTNDAQVATTVRDALGVEPLAIARQSLTQSGNEVFRIVLDRERSVALRLGPRPTSFAHTRHNLAQLRELGLPVPAFLAAGPTHSGGAFVILEWLAGRDLVFALPALRQSEMTQIAAAVTEMQRRVGTLAAGAGYGWAPIGERAASRTWTEVFGAPLADEAGAAPTETPLARLRRQLRAARRTLEGYFATVRPTCFLDDLTTKNVLIEAGSVRGIIDLDYVCYGDPLLAVGTTLAHLAADEGDAGRFYGEELLRCAQPSGDAARAVQFYAALWALGFMSAAATAGDAARLAHLEPIVATMLERAADG